MNKKMYEVLKNLKMEDLENFLENDVKQCFINSYLEPSFSGWYYNFGITENGEFYNYHASQDTMTVGQHDGSEFCLGSIKAYGSFYDDYCSGGTLVNLEFINQLSEEQQYDLLVSVSIESEIMEFEEEQEKNKDFELDLYTCYENFPSIVELIAEEKFPEIIEKLMKEDLEGYCWDIEKEKLIDNFLYRINTGIEYYEENCDEE